VDTAAGGARQDTMDEKPADAQGLPRCPFCGSTDTEELSPFASQLSTQQYVCLACHTPFEYFGRETAAR
jgi:transposase-like protein